MDGDGNFVANETRKTVSAGVDQPFVRNRSYLVNNAWYDCPDSGPVNIVQATAPNRSVYCKGYVDERALQRPLSLGGRLMSDVVNDIRSYGSLDGNVSYSGWGPRPASFPQLAATRFPAGATMEYPGTLLGSSTINGNVALFVGSYTETPSDAAYTSTVEIRVAFDANGNKARFTRNNRSVSTGFTTNYSTLMDTTYTIESVGGVRLLKFAAMPDGFEDRLLFARRFAERNGAVWYAFKDMPPALSWSIRLNGPASDALRSALGIQ